MDNDVIRITAALCLVVRKLVYTVAMDAAWTPNSTNWANCCGVSVSVCIGVRTSALLREVPLLVQSTADDHLAHQFLIQRISVVVLRGNTAAVLGCISVGSVGCFVLGVWADCLSIFLCFCNCFFRNLFVVTLLALWFVGFWVSDCGRTHKPTIHIVALLWHYLTTALLWCRVS